MRNKMIRKVLILFILVSYVVSDSCVRYTFEENFNELFAQRGFCASVHKFWVVGKYKDIDLSNEIGQRTTFITPAFSSTFSCVSSFSFPIAPGGTIEVNTYIKPSTNVDQILIVAHRLGINDLHLKDTRISSGQNNFVSGWHTLKIILPVEAIGDGYISLMGWASPNSILLIDSFRYIPPGMEESACRLYEDEPEPVPPTLQPTTPDPTTPESTTPDPTTPEETTPYPTTSEETTLKPTTPVVITPELTTPEEMTADPITPQVTTPEPTTLEVITPELTTPEEITADPITPEVTTPEPTTLEVITPELTTPEEITADPITPEITTPEPITPPDVTTPESTTPEVTTPEPTTPEVTTPENNYRYLLTVETWIKTQLSTSSKTM